MTDRGPRESRAEDFNSFLTTTVYKHLHVRPMSGEITFITPSRFRKTGFCVPHTDTTPKTDLKRVKSSFYTLLLAVTNEGGTSVRATGSWTQ
jgi:hypothetical protein